MIDDTESADGKYNFTDGCGSIGVNLATMIYEGMPDKVPEPDGYLPSAFQIR